MAYANEVANYLLHLRQENSEEGFNFSLTNLKIQKILYFCQAMFAIAQDGNRLIEDTEFEAWAYGPVIPEIYYRFNLYGQNEIPVGTDNTFNNLNRNEIDIIEQVWSTLRDKSAFDLVEISHANGGPWYNAFKERYNNKINHDDIFYYFGGQS